MGSRFFRQARRELREAKTDVVRQAEETRLLLRETAQRHMEAEVSVEGQHSHPLQYMLSLKLLRLTGDCVWVDDRFGYRRRSLWAR